MDGCPLLLLLLLLLKGHLHNQGQGVAVQSPAEMTRHRHTRVVSHPFVVPSLNQPFVIVGCINALIKLKCDFSFESDNRMMPAASARRLSLFLHSQLNNYSRNQNKKYYFLKGAKSSSLEGRERKGFVFMGRVP